MIRIAIFALIALAIVSTIGGYFYFQERQITGLQNKITQQQQQIAGMVIDFELLKTSHDTLVNEVVRKVEEMAEARLELHELRTADDASRKRVNELETKLEDQDRKKRIDAIRTSKKASLLLRLTNKDLKCFLENFNRINGTCIHGKFVIDGERLVPKGDKDDKDE